ADHFHVPGSPLADYAVTYGTAFPANLHIAATALVAGVETHFELTIAEPGRGSRNVLSAGFHSGPPSEPLLGLVSAIVRITSWNPQKHAVAGTFEATFSNGTTTAMLTGGKFSTTSMQ